MATIWSETLGQKIIYGGDDLNAFEQMFRNFAQGWMAFDMRMMMRAFQRHAQPLRRGEGKDGRNAKPPSALLSRLCTRDGGRLAAVLTPAGLMEENFTLSLPERQSSICRAHQYVALSIEPMKCFHSSCATVVIQTQSRLEGDEVPLSTTPC